ncbi:MAG: insulinase family protein, partial [Muribaculaceae bacterium]|nr:insulinase family protein [Muribaculaceae bacterium]
MIKYINRTLLVMLACIGFAFAAQAQQMPMLEVDTAVRIGQLPNGLTYYIRHNEYPKGQADFYIAQKVGSVLEEDNQRGLAHFLEHMCFNGTTHFPGNGLRDWLESIGVKFGYNLNAYTSVDETVYNISNVPVARKGVQDSCLLILHDWANDLTLDPEEIEKERGVIHEEWRRTHNGRQRIIERILPIIYPNNNRYGHRMVIGTMEVVDNFAPQALRDYYETWYRPDQQGIIVVGDIDVDYIEGKIKEIFADIEMPENAKERVYFPVEDTEGTIYAIGGDPEETVGIAELMFKQDAIPNEMKGSMQYLLIKYINGMIETMLDQRLTDMGNNPDAPFAQAGAGYGEFFMSKTKDAFNIVAVAKDNDVLPGFEAAYRELLRAARGGFTVGEYERARAEYLSRLEKAYNGRDTRENEGYVNEYVRHFIDNEPIPSIEDEYQIMSQMIAPNIPVEVINQVLPEYVTPDNRVLIALYPENGTFKAPTQADFEAIFAKVDAEEIEPYKDETKDEPLIPALPKPGKVAKVTDLPLWDAKELTLSNGVKVVVKTTNHKKDEILFEAVALGGTSAIGDEQAANLIYLPYAQGAHGLGTYNSIDLQRYLQGKQVGVDLSLGNYSRGLEGSSTVKDLPTLMELIYMTFTGYEFDPTEFEANQRKFASLLAAQEANPQFIFSRDLSKTIYASAASQVLTPDLINAASREGILSIIKSMTANAADYTFYFVGDVTVDQITPLLEQYIATLPANAKKASKGYVENLGREIAAGSETSTYTTKMDNPQTWCAILVEG